MRPPSPHTPQVRPVTLLTACPVSACPLLLLFFPAFALCRTFMYLYHSAPAMQGVASSGLLWALCQLMHMSADIVALD